MSGGQWADAHGVEHQAFAIERSEQRGAGIVGHAPVLVGQERVGVHAPVIVEQSPAPDDYEVGRLYGAVDGGHVVPGDGFDAMSSGGAGGVTGGDDDAQIGPARAELRKDGGKDGFVADIAEAVIADKKDHFLFPSGTPDRPRRFPALASRCAKIEV